MHPFSGHWAAAVRTEPCLSSSTQVLSGHPFIRNICPFERGSGLHADLLVSECEFYPSLLVAFIIARDGTQNPPLPLRCFPGL